MEEIEVPTEQVQEEIHHHAEHSAERWISGVALSSAIFAAFAAVSAMLSGHYSNEAMLEQIRASDSWAYYQAKGVKAAVLGSKMDLLTAEGRKVSDTDREKFGEYKKDQQEISDKAKELEKSSREFLDHHVVFARSVTLFQVAITVAAISVLTRRRKFWYVGIVLGLLGALSFVRGFLL